MPKQSSPRKRRRRKRNNSKRKPPSSPRRFTEEERSPRTPGRPYNPRTPVRSTGGRAKGKGKKHIVGKTPGGKDYYCGDVPVMPQRRAKSGKLEPKKRFMRRRLRKLELSLRLCEKEKRFRKRARSEYQRRSNELWNATVRALMRRYETSLRALGYDPGHNRLLGRLRSVFGDEVDELADLVNRRLFIE